MLAMRERPLTAKELLPRHIQIYPGDVVALDDGCEDNDDIERYVVKSIDGDTATIYGADYDEHIGIYVTEFEIPLNKVFYLGIYLLEGYIEDVYDELIRETYNGFIKKIEWKPKK